MIFGLGNEAKLNLLLRSRIFLVVSGVIRYPLKNECN